MSNKTKVWISLLSFSHSKMYGTFFSVWKMSHNTFMSVLGIDTVLVCRGCYNKTTYIEWLQTAETYSLTTLGVRSLTGSCHGAMLPLRALGKNLPCLFLSSSGCQQSFACLSLQLHHFSLSLYPHMTSSASVFTCPSFRLWIWGPRYSRKVSS